VTGPGRNADRRPTIIPAALRTPVRFLLPALLVALIGSLALTPVALADFWSPESGGSPNADEIDQLYWILFVLGIVVFLGVEGALVYSLFKFRARKGAVPAQIRGNTRLEIGWTVGAAVILVIIAIVTFIQLGDIRTAPNTQAAGLQLPVQNTPGETGTPDDRAFPRDGRALRIKVNGQQYVWRYTYPDGDDNTLNNAFDYETLVLPTDTTVTLEITAQDVAHSWWIPKLGGKFDAVPGHTNYTWVNIPGKLAGQTFRGQCAELCGRNHANMIAHVRALSPDDYEAYIERRKREIAAGNESAAEQRREIEGQN
jgi:cytochrome c oxidase subunit II